GLYQQGIAVGLALRRHGGADRAARARPVLDDERLPHLLREFRQQDARGDVVRTARGKRDDHAYGVGRISLGPCRARGPQHAGEEYGHTDCSHATPPPFDGCLGCSTWRGHYSHAVLATAVPAAAVRPPLVKTL